MSVHCSYHVIISSLGLGGSWWPYKECKSHFPHVGSRYHNALCTNTHPLHVLCYFDYLKSSECLGLLFWVASLGGCSGVLLLQSYDTNPTNCVPRDPEQDRHSSQSCCVYLWHGWQFIITYPHPHILTPSHPHPHTLTPTHSYPTPSHPQLHILTPPHSHHPHHHIPTPFTHIHSPG